MNIINAGRKLPYPGEIVGYNAPCFLIQKLTFNISAYSYLTCKLFNGILLLITIFWKKPIIHEEPQRSVLGPALFLNINDIGNCPGPLPRWWYYFCKLFCTKLTVIISPDLLRIWINFWVNKAAQLGANQFAEKIINAYKLWYLQNKVL